MRLADRIAQARQPFIAVCSSTRQLTRLSGVVDCANDIVACPIRYVLSDELTRLCAAIAYSKGARTLSCADWVTVPASRLWVEWTHAPWQDELDRHGFPRGDESAGRCGRRGALIFASRDGRRGSIRTFWCAGEEERDLCAGVMLAEFDFDSHAEECAVPARGESGAIRVITDDFDCGSTLSQCFSFRFEDSWGAYYDRACPSGPVREAIARHSLSTIALDIPLLVTFFLLLNTRSGLPTLPSRLDRINRSRCCTGKSPLLEHVNVRAPFPCGPTLFNRDSEPSGRKGPRLHHVRGHLVRRRNELFWRLPHLRGNPRAGIVKTRTVTWAF
jgi:hypothetical protein